MLVPIVFFLLIFKFCILIIKTTWIPKILKIFFYNKKIKLYKYKQIYIEKTHKNMLNRIYYAIYYTNYKFIWKKNKNIFNKYSF